MIYVLRYFYMKTVLSHLSPLYSNLIGLEPAPGSPSLVNVVQVYISYVIFKVASLDYRC